MAFTKRKRGLVAEINVVPYIDVMLVLLIIFMVTAPLITPSLIDLPSVGKGKTQPDKVIQIIVAKDESLELKVQDQKTRLALPGLIAAVQQAQGGDATLPVVISADRNVKYEAVVRVMDTLQRNGVQRVGLSVKLSP